MASCRMGSSRAILNPNSILISTFRWISDMSIPAAIVCESLAGGVLRSSVLLELEGRDSGSGTRWGGIGVVGVE